MAAVSTGHQHRHLGLTILGDESLAAKVYGLYMILLLVSMLLSYYIASHCRCTYLSEAGATLFVGFLGGGFLQLLVAEDKSDQFGEVEVRDSLVSFSSSVLFYLLLPPIIFNSGYRMRGNFFWSNIDKIMMLAFAGTFVSSIVVGVLLYEAQGMVSSEELSMAEALTFGALVSATDPVTTLGIFEQLSVDPHLFNVVFGESVLNDAVSIVLFHAFAKCIGYDGRLPGMVGFVTTNFVIVFVGSSLLGGFLGCCSALLFKHTKLHTHSHAHGPHLELAVFLVFCYAPFLLAECMSLSGVVAILFTGTAMKRYTYSNLSERAQEFAETMVSLVAHVAEAFIFIDLGTSAWQTFHASFGLIALALLACLAARAAHVYPIGFVLNALPIKYPRRRFEKPEMHIVWFSGLRGAIAYALSTQFPGPHRKCIMSLTMGIVLVTVWVFGGATSPMLRWLGIRQMQPEQLRQLSLTLEPFVNRLTLVHWDRKYIRPMLVRQLVVGDGCCHNSAAELREVEDEEIDTEEDGGRQRLDCGSRGLTAASAATTQEEGLQCSPRELRPGTATGSGGSSRSTWVQMCSTVARSLVGAAEGHGGNHGGIHGGSPGRGAGSEAELESQALGSESIAPPLGSSEVGERTAGAPLLAAGNEDDIDAE